MSETLTDTLPLTAFRENPVELLQRLKTTHRRTTLIVFAEFRAKHSIPA